MKYKITDTYSRGSSFEVRYDILDDDDKLIIGGLTRPTKFKEMDKTQADKLFNDVIFPAFSEGQEEPEKIYTETEIVEILMEKKYLVEGQKMEDLATKVDVKA